MRRCGGAKLPPDLLSDAFTVKELEIFLKRRARAPMKAVLLMQERFPGIGNWMADEILWRAAIHPKQLAGELTAGQTRALYKEIRWVCREALRIIGEKMGRRARLLALQSPLEKGRNLSSHRREAAACHHRRPDNVLVAREAEITGLRASAPDLPCIRHVQFARFMTSAVDYQIFPFQSCYKLYLERSFKT